MSDQSSSLLTQVEALKGYLQHKPGCELMWPVAKPQPAAYGRYLMKRVNGRIVHGWEHICGAQGFGHPDDECPGCDRAAEEREPRCSCGLDQLQPLLVFLVEQQRPKAKEQALLDAAGLCESEANKWRSACPKTAEHWEKVATVLRSNSLCLFVEQQQQKTEQEKP